MSVKVKLNNRSFFGDGPMIVGSRLFEAEETVSQTPAAPVNSSANVDSSANSQSAQQPTISQQVEKIINLGFATLAQNVANEVVKIQGPQWPAYPQQQASAQETIAAVQKYLGDVINVAKTTQQNQQPAANQ